MSSRLERGFFTWLLVFSQLYTFPDERKFPSPYYIPLLKLNYQNQGFHMNICVTQNILYFSSYQELWVCWQYHVPEHSQRTHTEEVFTTTANLI